MSEGGLARGLSRTMGVVRAEQWWTFKLIPPLAIVYAGCVRNNVSIAAHGPAIALLLLALASGAGGVSLLNDLFDRDSDRLAGKANRMTDRSGGAVAAMLAVPLLATIGIGWFWRGNALLLAAYAGAWLAFLLYSLPPFRLKGRGFLGVAADSAGAHLMPALMAALLVTGPTLSASGLLWLAVIALWSWAVGVRGNVWHQLEDRDCDLQSGVGTFVTRTSADHSVRVVKNLIFPLELVSLAALLWLVDSMSGWLALLAYLMMLRLKIALFQVTPVIVRSRPRYAIVLQDYYLVFLPLALLARSSLSYPADALVLALHLACFASVHSIVAVEAVRLARRYLPSASA